MKDFIKNGEWVHMSDRIQFKCQQCSRCCRRVKEVVPVESLDLFRLTKCLRDVGAQVTTMEDSLLWFTDLVLIDRSGYCVPMLKSVGDDDRCIFLDGNHCAIHDANPRACRTYPFETGPAKDGSFEIVLSREQPHHFKGNTVLVKSWLQKTMLPEDREFVRYDVSSACEIAELLNAVPEADKARALTLFVHYKYTAFDLEKPFMAQYRANTDSLVSELRLIAAQRRNDI